MKVFKGYERAVADAHGIAAPKPVAEKKPSLLERGAAAVANLIASFFEDTVGFQQDPEILAQAIQLTKDIPDNPQAQLDFFKTALKLDILVINEKNQWMLMDSVKRKELTLDLAYHVISDRKIAQ